MLVYPMNTANQIFTPFCSSLSVISDSCRKRSLLLIYGLLTKLPFLPTGYGFFLVRYYNIHKPQLCEFRGFHSGVALYSNLWGVTMCSWKNSSRYFEDNTRFRNVRTTRPTQRHILQVFKHQLKIYCKNDTLTNLVLFM